jgi:hypothetical protein
MVGGKKYPYTEKGKNEAEKAKQAAEKAKQAEVLMNKERGEAAPSARKSPPSLRNLPNKKNMPYRPGTDKPEVKRMPYRPGTDKPQMQKARMDALRAAMQRKNKG